VRFPIASFVAAAAAVEARLYAAYGGRGGDGDGDGDGGGGGGGDGVDDGGALGNAWLANRPFYRNHASRFDFAT
jgi:hypothetical protein